ncbi:hypothetical protein OK414_28935 [Priestia sp. JV24]|uniref:hypothetical protein n=1 Tax=Priestia TaxID=2800373 RepID=UPI0021D69D64|nr:MULTISPECIES: hypothetical protein [Priestia]MCU7712678.1 hypothetical protein [Priestia megaterium]MCW1049079.1 hypothetical protein [Priestia sp. JV24]
MNKISIEYAHCRNSFLKKEINEAVLYNNFQSECCMQTDDRYFLESNINKEYTLSNNNPVEYNVEFLPKLLEGLSSDYSCYCLVSITNLNGYEMFIQELDTQKVKYQVINEKGYVQLSTKSEYEQLSFIMIKFEDIRKFSSLFENFIFHIATDNQLVTIWLDSMPCFTLPTMSTRMIKNYSLPVVLGAKEYVISISYDADNIQVFEKEDYSKTGDFLNKIKNIFAIEEVKQVDYVCCGEEE